MHCVGDRRGEHDPDCRGTATVLVRQEDCPPGCDHPLSPECLTWCMLHAGGVRYEAVGRC